MYENTLLKAIEYFGSQKSLARALGVSQQAVGHWLNRGQRIPYVQAMKIAILSNGLVSIDELTPDQKYLNTLFKNSAFLKGIPIVTLSVCEIKTNGKKCPIYKESKEISLEITEQELKRPILVDARNQLVTCECRLRAQQSLGREKVKVNRLNLKDVITGEISIAALIRDFPISERVDIGLCLEQEMGKHQGKRTDLRLPDNYPEVMVGNETREIIAKIAGVGSAFTYRQAKSVVKHGIPELIKAMDCKLLAIYKAGEVSRRPGKEQQLFLAMMQQKFIKDQVRRHAKNPNS